MVGLAALLWAQTAAAHLQQGEANGFLTGFQHPITGLDHVLAMVAVRHSKESPGKLQHDVLLRVDVDAAVPR